ncbi:hypothetical protein HZ996_08940 [Cryomorphaceae bacterium]|nr:hypothetical protein HZ996_08940 [Cryomorphaceae bacterium]
MKFQLLSIGAFALLLITSCEPKDAEDDVMLSYTHTPDTLVLGPGQSGAFTGQISASPAGNIRGFSSIGFPSNFEGTAFTGPNSGNYADTLQFPFNDESMAGNFFRYEITTPIDADGLYEFEVYYIEYYDNSQDDAETTETYYVNVIDDTGGGDPCRDDLIASYTIDDSCAPAGFPPTVGDIVTAGSENEFIFTMELTGTAQITAITDCPNDALTIPLQTINTGQQDLDISGTGTYTVTTDGITIIMVYDLVTTGSSDPPTTCTATWTSN